MPKQLRWRLASDGRLFTGHLLQRFATLIIVSAGLFAAICPIIAGEEARSARSPNVVLILADDLGYGDLGCYGHPTLRTPNLDQMAAEGTRFTQFYVAASVCTPSRAGLLTGRLPIRSGMCSAKRRVLFPDSNGGLPASEVTVAEALQQAGYATACIGKWHLGHLPEYLPTAHGFDEYFGVPYSNDMLAKPATDNRPEWPPLPLMRNESVAESDPDQGLLTERYTEETLKFIDAHRDEPFFIYLPHTMPHVPLYASEKFRGTSPRGLYGDVVETIDWSVGQILEKLHEHNLQENTLVFFTSDNGPWLIKGDHGGSAGLLRDGKGCTFEGGMREPAIAWWPGHVPAGVISPALGSTLDLLPTMLALANIPLPEGRTLDGYNLAPVWLGQQQESPRQEMFFYRGTELFAVRQGPWKAHFKTQAAYGGNGITDHNPPLLYNLEIDPSEQYDVAGEHSDVIQQLTNLADAHRRTVEPVENQLEK